MLVSILFSKKTFRLPNEVILKRAADFAEATIYPKPYLNQNGNSNRFVAKFSYSLSPFAYFCDLLLKDLSDVSICEGGRSSWVGGIPIDIFFITKRVIALLCSARLYSTSFEGSDLYLFEPEAQDPSS